MKFYLENKYSDFFSRKHCFLSVGPSTYVCLYTPLLFHFILEFLQICHACLLPYEDLHMLRKCDWTFCEGLGLLCLTPLLTIFQLYCGSQFYWWMKLEYPTFEGVNSLFWHISIYIYICLFIYLIFHQRDLGGWLFLCKKIIYNLIFSCIFLVMPSTI